MNISRNAFYTLVKMQNLLNELRIEKSYLSDLIQDNLELAIDDLQSGIQGLTSTYLKEVDRNREESSNAIWAEIKVVEDEPLPDYETETFQWAQKMGLIR